MLRTVTHTGEVVALPMVGENAGDRACVACLQATLEVRIGVDMSAEINTRTHAATGLHQGHFEAGIGKTPSSHSTAGPTSYYNHVEKRRRHEEYSFTRRVCGIPSWRKEGDLFSWHTWPYLLNHP